MSTANDDAHWIEVVDGQGLIPAKLLGPYGTARLADRAQRGVMRLLNVARYTAVVMSQRDLEGRGERTGIASRSRGTAPVPLAEGGGRPTQQPLE